MLVILTAITSTIIGTSLVVISERATMNNRRIEESSINIVHPNQEDIIEATLFAKSYTTDDFPFNVANTSKFNENEKKLILRLMDAGVTDLMAISVVMGSIYQESRVDPRACSPGKTVDAKYCTGSFGIVQWTDSRFNDLKRFGKQNNCDINTIDCQIDFMFSEHDFQRALKEGFSIPDKPMSFYMDWCWEWKRWGVLGNRYGWAKDYLSSFNKIGTVGLH